MKARAGGCIHIEIGMMHLMQPPEGGQRMAHDMLQIDGEIEDEKSRKPFKPERPIQRIEQAPAIGLRINRHRIGRRADRQTHGNHIHDQNADVGHPALAPRLHARMLRKAPFGNRDKRENAEEDGKADGFSGHGVLLGATCTVKCTASSAGTQTNKQTITTINTCSIKPRYPAPHRSRYVNT